MLSGGARHTNSVLHQKALKIFGSGRRPPIAMNVVRWLLVIVLLLLVMGFSKS